MLTFSGNGLDSNISVKVAKLQANRIAKTGNIAEEKLLNLIKQNAVAPFIGYLVTEKISVSELNIALDKLK